MKAVGHDRNSELIDAAIRFADMIGGFKEKYSKMWWETNTELNCIGKRYDWHTQLLKEKATDRFVKYLTLELSNIPGPGYERKVWRGGIRNSTHKYGSSIGLAEGYMEILLMGGFARSTGAFVREARAFEPGIKLEDILQAIRNVWIMNSIQVFLGREVEYSPSIFAYSMLYPYTDNYLDSNSISFEDKMNNNRRFRRRLAGEPLSPSNVHEKAIFSLVQMVEQHYPRMFFPYVYESLLGIHNAQEKSLSQQRNETSPYETNILDISLEKGGISVLADAYLVNGNLTREQADFMFGFGVILQLADDLQDAETDRKNGHMTIFSQTAGKWNLDGITVRLFNFIACVVDSSEAFSSTHGSELKSMIKFNCYFLMLQAISKNRRLFGKEFVKSMEIYSMFRFDYMRKLYKRLQNEYHSLDRNLKGMSADELIASAITGD